MIDLSQSQSSPEAYARSLLSHLRLKRIGDLASFVALLGLRIREVDSEDFEGALLRVPQQLRGIVAIKCDIREEGRKRFTVCHEVGHFILPGHGATDCICLASEVESWRTGIPEQELAANRFGAELLLPYKEVAPLVHKNKATIGLAKKISVEFDSSLTAAALKCVEVTEEKCALVYSVNGVIKWFRANDNFHYFIRVNQKVDDDSFAGQLFRNAPVEEPDGAVPAEAWLESDRLLPNARVWEDSILLPHYDSTITILTVHRQIS
jgi:hypothetical protein